jgi:hypothetical protein
LENILALDTNRVVISQRLIFRQGPRIIEARDYDVSKISVVKDSRKYLLLENVICEAGIAKGTKGMFYDIEGSGLCNSCSQNSEYFSLNGKPIYKEYVANDKSIHERFGSFEKIMDTYGINKSKQTGRFTNTWVFPPQRSGKSID